MKYYINININNLSNSNYEKGSEKRGKIMCKKLKELMGMSTAKILETYHDGHQDSYAVDMQNIMKNIGVLVSSYDFSDLSQKVKQNILGAIILHADDLAVFVSNKCSNAEQRFILAHELGHCCLHGSTLKATKIECASDFDSKDPHEHEADLFADELLLPERELMEVCKMFDAQKVDNNILADIFCVPPKCVVRRLKTLNIG